MTHWLVRGKRMPRKGRALLLAARLRGCQTCRIAIKYPKSGQRCALCFGERRFANSEECHWRNDDPGCLGLILVWRFSRARASLLHVTFFSSVNCMLGPCSIACKVLAEQLKSSQLPLPGCASQLAGTDAIAIFARKRAK